MSVRNGTVIITKIKKEKFWDRYDPAASKLSYVGGSSSPVQLKVSHQDIY